MHSECKPSPSHPAPTFSLMKMGLLLKQMPLQKLSALLALVLLWLRAMLSPCVSWNCRGRSDRREVKSPIIPATQDTGMSFQINGDSRGVIPLKLHNAGRSWDAFQFQINGNSRGVILLKLHNTRHRDVFHF